MAKTSCHCKKPHECEECPEWIFTFADLVMLMMGFFVILWVLKPNPTANTGSGQANEKWVETAAAIREAFDYKPDPNSNDPVDRVMIEQARHEKHNPGDGGKINEQKKSPEGHEDQTTSIRIGKYATEGGKLTFDKNDATLSANAKGALTEVAQLVRGHRNLIIIKGHTSLDDLPDGTPDEKMELSLHRANAAADFLHSQGVDAALLRVEGCSTFEPVVRRQYTPEALLANRRVEIEATATLVEDLQDHPPSANGLPLPATQPAGKP